MNWQHFFGNAVMVCGLLMVFIGIPSQILKNYREKRCGVPVTSAVLSFMVFLTRIGYSTTISSHYLLIPDSIGIVLAVALLAQHAVYRKKTRN